MHMGARPEKLSFRGIYCSFFCNMKRWWCLGLSYFAASNATSCGNVVTLWPPENLPYSVSYSGYCDTVPEIPNTLGSTNTLYTRPRNPVLVWKKNLAPLKSHLAIQSRQKSKWRADAESQKFTVSENRWPTQLFWTTTKDPQLQKTILKQY